MGLIARALAKNSLNLVCAVRGHDVALQPQYDAIRAFARTGERDPDEFVSMPESNGEGRKQDPELPFLCRPGHHTGVLFSAHGAVWAAWSFFGLSFVLVRLGPDEEPWPPFPFVVDFDYTAKTWWLWDESNPTELFRRCNLGPNETAS
jgi:hypothetical protein